MKSFVPVSFVGLILSVPLQQKRVKCYFQPISCSQAVEPLISCDKIKFISQNKICLLFLPSAMLVSLWCIDHGTQGQGFGSLIEAQACETSVYIWNMYYQYSNKKGQHWRKQRKIKFTMFYLQPGTVQNQLTADEDQIILLTHHLKLSGWITYSLW